MPDNSFFWAMIQGPKLGYKFYTSKLPTSFTTNRGFLEWSKLSELPWVHANRNEKSKAWIEQGSEENYWHSLHWVKQKHCLWCILLHLFGHFDSPHYFSKMWKRATKIAILKLEDKFLRKKLPKFLRRLRWAFQSPKDAGHVNTRSHKRENDKFVVHDS